MEYISKKVAAYGQFVLVKGIHHLNIIAKIEECYSIM